MNVSPQTASSVSARRAELLCFEHHLNSAIAGPKPRVRKEEGDGSDLWSFLRLAHVSKDLVLVSQYWGAAGGAHRAVGTTLTITSYITLGTGARVGCTG